jgi:phosphoglycerol transferase MdoB-like AlkP superfamily enzyme
LFWGGVWHGYADYFALGGRGTTSWILIILLGPILLTAWSIIITWVYERTQGSLLLAYFMHASISSSALIFGQTYASDAEEITWTAISVGLAILAAMVIWVFVRKQEATKVATKLGNYGWSE